MASESPDPTVTAEPPPADPEAARLFAKVRRLMLLSLAGTLLAIGSVLAIVGYRIMKAEEPIVSREATIVLPKGARVLSASMAEGSLAVSVEIEGTVELRLYQPRSLRLERRIQLLAAP